MTLSAPCSMFVLGIALSVVGYVVWNAVTGLLNDRKLGRLRPVKAKSRG